MVNGVCTFWMEREFEWERMRRMLKAKSTSLGRPERRERVSLDRPISVSGGREGGGGGGGGEGEGRGEEGKEGREEGGREI